MFMQKVWLQLSTRLWTMPWRKLYNARQDILEDQDILEEQGLLINVNQDVLIVLVFIEISLLRLTLFVICK